MEGNKPRIDHITETIECINRGIMDADLHDPDTLMAIEDSVWTDIFEPSIGTWRTKDEADRDFLAWRNQYVVPRLPQQAKSAEWDYGASACDIPDPLI